MRNENIIRRLRDVSIRLYLGYDSRAVPKHVCWLFKAEKCQHIDFKAVGEPTLSSTARVGKTVSVA